MVFLTAFRFENPTNEKKRSSKLGVFFSFVLFVRDPDLHEFELYSRIQVFGGFYRCMIFQKPFPNNTSTILINNPEHQNVNQEVRDTAEDLKE